MKTVDKLWDVCSRGAKADGNDAKVYTEAEADSRLVCDYCNEYTDSAAPAERGLICPECEEE